MIAQTQEQKKAGYSTRPGYVNPRGQVVIRNTGLAGTDHGQTVYQMACSVCGHVYGANGSDVHNRRCPLHDHGAAGLNYKQDMFSLRARMVH
jgi:hypothetical protein